MRGIERQATQGETRGRFADGSDFFENAGGGEGENAGGGRDWRLAQSRFEVRMQRRPRRGQQAVLVLVPDARGGGNGGAEEMQLATRARAGNVEEALALFVEANLTLIADPGVQGFCVFSVEADGGDQEFVFGGVTGTGPLE